MKSEFLNHPVTTIIGEPRDLPEWQRVHGTAVMPQLQTADRDALDSAAYVTDFNVLPEPEGILGQVEDPREHIANDSLRAEAKGEANHAGTGEEWANVYAKRGEHGHCGNDGNRREDRASQ